MIQRDRLDTHVTSELRKMPHNQNPKVRAWCSPENEKVHLHLDMPASGVMEASANLITCVW